MPTAEASADVMLRPLTDEDLPAAQALSASFDWPHRVEDWRFMLALGAGIAAEQEGRLAGTALHWRYGADRGALGMVNVAPALQGRGLGRRLTEATLAELDGRVVALHATEAGLPLYQSLGFTPSGIVRQYQGAVFQAGLIDLAEGERLRPIGRSDPEALAALDRAVTGTDRRPVLDALLAAGTGVVLDRAGEAIGYALLRRFGRGHLVGPVIAPDAPRASALIGHFLASRSGQFLRIDVPEESGLSPWLAGLGMADAGAVTRMVRGRDARPTAGGARSFALISQAFG
jgi:GNAT superfamily N-acetyltransferase